MQARPTRAVGRGLVFGAVLVTVLGALFGLPWLTLVIAPDWPAWATAAGTILFAAAAIAFPVMMFLGHARGRDRASRVGDTTLGVIWVLFVWSLLGTVVRLFGVDARVVALGVAAIAAVLVAWGYVEAMRVPRVKRVDVTIPRLGKGLDGLRVVLLTDTHYGPIDRAKWSSSVIDKVNELDADIVCHTGDIADGTVDQRREQAAPLGRARARLARGYVTGNHEHFGEAQRWVEHMGELGWQALENRHTVVERDGDRLVLAGVSDATTRYSIENALNGTDPQLPVLLLAHQPKQVVKAAAAGVDLQISGHTHGGQIWPFNLLVRIDQPVVSGLSRHGERTQLYTSNGTGFWGPPLRVFAPSEITLITLRSGA